MAGVTAPQIVLGARQRGDRMEILFGAVHESAYGTFRTWRDVRLESVMRTKADVRRPLQIYGFTPQQTFSEACGAPLRPALILPDGQISHSAVQSRSQKYFHSRFTQITSISPPSRPTERGDRASSRTRDGMRWTRERKARNGNRRAR